ncbi:hypothetical protein NLG97_g7979 [Lecanicillium saksenae]|uniref:Uncharacterized protein n=1 Tax=Lecanicillium saksenae TaxID=468837 RepID=A0ACC1QKA0_9HYPO|nr:hypothetical protein NLG97_g7979 [Lecanicillium saksenae]
MEPTSLFPDSYYAGKQVFLTGGTGMLGLALVCRLIFDTPVERVYVLVRGGPSHFWEEVDSHLLKPIATHLRASGKVKILQGDITEASCGLSDDQVRMIQRDVSVIVHAASTIALRKPLPYVLQHIIEPSMALAQLALGCAHLSKFVYVSTAYVNTFLRCHEGSVTGADALIKEDIRAIAQDGLDNPVDELHRLRSSGSTREFDDVRHLSTYTYAKHLTERLILGEFSTSGNSSKLLIFRPSVIGPAEVKPYPFYEKPGSSPSTMVAAGILASPPRPLVFSSHLNDPKESRLDEIPVDMVVNRLIVHTAAGTCGIVHAVAGPECCTSMDKALVNITALRRFWWGKPTVIWTDCHWHDPKLWSLARLVTIAGCFFKFEDSKTKQLIDQVSGLDLDHWPLFSTGESSLEHGVAARRRSLRTLIGQYLSRKYRVPSRFARVLV